MGDSFFVCGMGGGTAAERGLGDMRTRASFLTLLSHLLHTTQNLTNEKKSQRVAGGVHTQTLRQ